MLVVYILASLYTISVLNCVHIEKRGVRNRNYKSENAHFYSTCGDDLCVCLLRRAICRGNHRHLQYIPRLPTDTAVLTFSKNYLPVITSKTFYNISDLNLQMLSLSDNNVISITSGAFNVLVYLKTLILRKEPGLLVSEVADAFNGLGVSTIKINEMRWSEIQQNIFANLYGPNLGSINLMSNKLWNLDFKIFSNLTSLTMLSLYNNRLLELKMYRIETLQSLNIGQNTLYRIPNFCYDFDIHKRQGSYLPALRSLSLEFNYLRNVSTFSFKCLPSLNELLLRGNPLMFIENNFIASLRFLYLLDISQLSSLNQPKIGKFAFNSTSLTRFLFEECNFATFYTPFISLKYCPNLTELSFANSIFPLWDTWYNISLPLTQIQKIDFSFTGLEYLPEYVFSNMRSLQYLDLSNNQLSSWDGKKVFGNSNISTLSLNKNHISSINETSIPQSMLNSTRNTFLDISDNFYLCTCETRESINWFRKYADLLLKYPESYKCFGPDNVKNTKLQNYNPSPESCAEKNIALLVSLPMSIIAVLTMSVIFMVYKCRWRLRYGVYNFMNRHKNYERMEGSDGFVYTGFVIYSDDDRTWVHNELLQRIEDQEGFRLCIRLRDFDVGKVHVDNIVENMFLSEKIIVVLSNNFAKDEWCHFQLLLAETRLLKQNTDMLVIFMLEEIRSTCLRASLYKLVTERQYALWSNDGTGNSLFWEQAVSYMKRSTELN